MDVVTELARNDRVRVRRAGDPDSDGSCVVYWMQRSQRAIDNPALDVAIRLGNELRKPVVVFLAPMPFYPHANLRHYSFLAEGIGDIAQGVLSRNVGLVLRTYPDHSLMRFADEVRPAIVIGDENPLRETEEWRVKVSRNLKMPFWTVDSDVIVPSLLLGREHFAARTIRPKIHELLPQFLVPARSVKAHVRWQKPKNLESLRVGADLMAGWPLDRSVHPISGCRGGTRQGMRVLKEFLADGLRNYPVERNRPERNGTSHLSPYLHFGQISPLTIALAVRTARAPAASKQAFLEQLIVRRELAVNFVRFNPTYDSFESLEPWAERSFARHAGDRRPVIYTDEQLDRGETQDPLWNAAQKQMVLTGWMHNYLRMYWAKKILEWSPSVATAYRRAVWLNDRYELDGRDPNGYAGIAWAIVGKHDRPWFERPIFGTVRYMSFASTSKKFDSRKYIEQVNRLERG